jgi:hypothetical protein
MTYQQFREQMYIILSRNVLSTERKIQQEYARAYKSIYAQMARVYANLGQVKKEDYFLEMSKFDRLNKLLAEIESIMKRTSASINIETLKASRESVSNSYYMNQFASNWISPYPVTILNERAVNLSVYYTEKAWNDFYKAAKTEAIKTIGKNAIPKNGKTLKEIEESFIENTLAKKEEPIPKAAISGDKDIKPIKGKPEMLRKWMEHVITVEKGLSLSDEVPDGLQAQLIEKAREYGYIDGTAVKKAWSALGLQSVRKTVKMKLAE